MLGASLERGTTTNTHAGAATSESSVPQTETSSSTTSSSSPHILVCKASHAPGAKVTLEDMELNVNNWNSGYSFVGSIGKVSATDYRLSDPTFLILRVDLPRLVTHFQHFSLINLQNLASSHRVTYKGLPKPIIIALLIAHECQNPCSPAFYVFKEIPSVRPPWNLGRAPRSSTLRHNPMTIADHTPQEPPIESILHMDSTRPIDEDDCITIETEQGPAIRVTTSHLKEVSERAKADMIHEWQQDMDVGRFLRRTCAVCSELKFYHNIERIHASEVPLHLLKNEDLPENLRPVSYNEDAYDRAILDPEGLEDPDSKGWMAVCPNCSKDLERGEMPRLALANWLYYARERLPIDVKQAFTEMSVFEKALISRVRTNSILCRFAGMESDLNGAAFATGRRHI